jgi:hypothetical protein
MGVSVEVVVVSYRYQEQGAELVGEGSALPGNDLVVASEQLVSTKAGDFRELLATDPRRSGFITRYRYYIGGRQFTRPLWSQLWYGLRSLAGAPPSALVAFGTVCDLDCEQAKDRLEAFTVEMEPRIRQSLPRHRLPET